MVDYENSTHRPPIGLQTILFGRDTDTESATFLDRLQEIGYTALESNPSDPAGFKARLEERGMDHAGLHFSAPGLRDIDTHIETLKILGAKDICNSGPIDWNDRSAENWRKTIDLLNTTGLKLRDAGCALHYHNHDLEWNPIEGEDKLRPIDMLLDRLDFDLVDFCIDVAWVTKAGDDPAAFLRRHADKISYLHLKDYDDHGWCPLGQGVVDLRAVEECLAELPRVRWCVVEQDQPRDDPYADARTSREYLENEYNW